MKSTIAYYLLLIYMFALVKPFVPIIEDIVSHTFSEASHLSTVHMVYGADHSEKEFSDEAKDNHDDKKDQQKKSSQGFGEYTLLTSISNVIQKYSLYSYSYFKINRWSPSPLVVEGPPPRFSC